MHPVPLDQPPTSSSESVGGGPFFYGWVMLPVAMIAQFATSRGQSFAIAVFNQSFTETLQLSERQLTGAFGLGTLLASFSLPLFGALMDRWGIRRSMSLVVLMLGGACLFASQVRGIAMLFAAFFLLRMLGQGALGLMAANTLAMWFRRRLGMATSTDVRAAPTGTDRAAEPGKGAGKGEGEVGARTRPLPFQKILRKK